MERPEKKEARDMMEVLKGIWNKQDKMTHDERIASNSFAMGMMAARMQKGSGNHEGGGTGRKAG